jgi:hypothetical protein
VLHGAAVIALGIAMKNEEYAIGIMERQGAGIV